LDRKFPVRFLVGPEIKPETLAYIYVVGGNGSTLSFSSSSSTNHASPPWLPLLLYILSHGDFPPLIFQIHSTTSIPSCSGSFSPRGFPFEDLLREDFGLLQDFLYLKFFPFLGQGDHVFG
jgi:hypothetical protein